MQRSEPPVKILLSPCRRKLNFTCCWCWWGSLLCLSQMGAGSLVKRILYSFGFSTKPAAEITTPTAPITKQNLFSTHIHMDPIKARLMEINSKSSLREDKWTMFILYPCVSQNTLIFQSYKILFVLIFHFRNGSSSQAEELDVKPYAKAIGWRVIEISVMRQFPLHSQVG